MRNVPVPAQEIVQASFYLMLAQNIDGNPEQNDASDQAYERKSIPKVHLFYVARLP